MRQNIMQRWAYRYVMSSASEERQLLLADISCLYRLPYPRVEVTARHSGEIHRARDDRFGLLIVINEHSRLTSKDSHMPINGNAVDSTKQQM